MLSTVGTMLPKLLFICSRHSFTRTLVDGSEDQGGGGNEYMPQQPSTEKKSVYLHLVDPRLLDELRNIVRVNVFENERPPHGRSATARAHLLGAPIGA